jgi:hypothetical protein
MKEKTEKNLGVAATRRLGVSRYAKDRLARLAAMRDAPGVAFEDRDAIDWAIRLATQAAERNAAMHDGDWLRNMALVTAIVESVGNLVQTLGAEYTTDDQMHLYEHLGFKPRREGARK